MKRVFYFLLSAIIATCLWSCTNMGTKLEIGAEVKELVSSGIIMPTKNESHYDIKDSYFMDIPFEKHFVEVESGKVKYIRYTNYSEMYQEVYSSYKETLKNAFTEKYGNPFYEDEDRIVWEDGNGITYSIIEFINEVNPFVTTHLINVTICHKSDVEI